MAVYNPGNSHVEVLSMLKRGIALGLAFGIWPLAWADEVGSVDTAWKMLGANHKISVVGFDDPKVQGVACHLSMAVTGGLLGSVGLAEDSSDASIACRQVGEIKFLEEFEAGERVFRESRSILFKSLQVVRFCDEGRNTLVYLSYSDKLIDGSPKNAISTVPIGVWGGTGEAPQCSDEES